LYCNLYAEEISALARLVKPPSLFNGHLHLAATFCINCYLHRPMENGVSIFLNSVTQQQSMYKACSVNKVPTSIIVFNNPSILWWEILTVIKVTCSRWCKIQLIMLFRG